MEESTTTAGGVNFPSRRRVWQACTNCRARKTRCDAAKPRCGLCIAQKVQCVYTDSQQPRVEHNTRLLLERIQLLEDRLLSSPGFSQPPPPAGSQSSHRPVVLPSLLHQDNAPQSDHLLHERPNAEGEDESVRWEMPIPQSHTANANHVLNWPIVQHLISSVQEPGGGFAPALLRQDGQLSEATDVFFDSSLQSRVAQDATQPVGTWNLFDQHSLSQSPDITKEYMDYIHSYFEDVNIFFPILSFDEVVSTFENVVTKELHIDSPQSRLTSPSQYCMLLLVLCLGSFARHKLSAIRLTGEETLAVDFRPPVWQSHVHQRMWQKAQLLLGCIAADPTVNAAQCTMLASIYMGACGKTPASHHWSHTTSVKCAEIAKRSATRPQDPEFTSESFRRLYWIAFIYEGDFSSELSIISPSGIARYEDDVPYPSQSLAASRALNTADVIPDQQEKNEILFPFQISTNAAIRRLLNRVHSMVYDSKDHFRITHVEYVQWLLRVSEDFSSYHANVYQNLPYFLLHSQPERDDEALSQLHTSPKDDAFSFPHGLCNNPWNVLRLKGRHYATQHIIYRPFIDYVLLNLDHITTHPDKEVILQKCGLSLEACKGFISVFDVDEVNSTTCLFATGMATFTYLVVLRVATVCPVFGGVLPHDVEDTIAIGKRNLRRFGISIQEFSWHLQVLESLDYAARCREQAPGRSV